VPMRSFWSKLAPAGKPLVAVDFDSRTLRIVQAARSGRQMTILKLAGATVPPELSLTDPQAVGEFLGRTLVEMGLAGSNVVMNVPRGQAVLKPLTLPPGTQKAELAQMVQLQMAKELPFRPEEAVIDFTTESHYDIDQAQTRTPEGVPVLVAATRLPVVDHYRQIAASAEVKLLRLGLRPYADHHCLRSCTDPGPTDCVALVHVTADETEIDVLEGRALSFSRSAVVEVPAPAEDNAAAVAETVRELTMEVARSFQSFQAVEGGRHVEKVLVAGGTGIEALLVDQLARRLGIPCELFSPARWLPLPDGPDVAAFISALGLTLGQRGEQLPFDFLNPKRPPVQRDVRKIRAALVAVLVVIGVVAGIAYGWSYLDEKDARLSKLRSTYKALEKDRKSIRKLGDRVEGIEAWRDAKTDWLALWTHISCLFPSAQDAYITDLKGNADGSVSFTVHAKSKDIVTALGKKLAASGYQYKPQKSHTSNDKFGYLFQTSMRVRRSEAMPRDLARLLPLPRPADDISADPEAVRQQLQRRRSSGGGNDRRSRRSGRGRR